MTCKPIVEDPFTEKKLESKPHRKYQVNLLNKPQHLAKIKAPKLLKFPSKGITNLRKRKFKNNELKLRENKQKVREKCPRQFSNVKVRVLLRDWLICEITRAAREYKCYKDDNVRTRKQNYRIIFN